MVRSAPADLSFAPPVPPRPAAVAQLSLTDIRNHASSRLAVVPDPARPVVLTGPNGAGKTAILEALSLLGPGRGLRQARMDDLARTDGPGGWAVSATVELAGEEQVLGTGQTPQEGEAGRRQARIDRQPASGPAALGERLAMIWLTPAMDRLFQEPAAVRRRFLDRFADLMLPGHARALAAYEQAMRDRLRLLSERGYLGADPGWLAALEARMAEHGLGVAQGRARAVAALTVQLARAEADGFPAGEAGLSGWLEERLAQLDAESLAKDFALALKQGRAGDARSGRTELGPHRSDLTLVYRARGLPARLCSTGEQKALMFSLVLAQADTLADKRGAAPLVLMDEVAAHLDPDRRARLFARLRRLGGQAWLTGTDPELFGGIGPGAQYFDVVDGRVSPA